MKKEELTVPGVDVDYQYQKRTHTDPKDVWIPCDAEDAERLVLNYTVVSRLNVHVPASQVQDPEYLSKLRKLVDKAFFSRPPKRRQD